jgi:dolichyl-diphosphooligosaccharide--protein glycosyltransferase
LDHRKTGLLLAFGAAILAFGLRIANAPRVFQHGLPMLAPFDELYHWKRITFSVQNFPAILSFDPDRGLSGAFCPWPPLYDLGAAAIALLAGASSAFEVLRVIVWIPPVVTSLLIGVTIAILGRGAPRMAVVAAMPMAAAPFLVFASSLADIDHHFLEPFLALAIAGATVLVLRAADVRRAVLSGIALAAAIAAAMFVQTALIVAAALAFACVLFGGAAGTGAKPLQAAIIGFGGSALAVAAYRLGQPPGYPDGPWFLGWSHAALLAGAAAAAAVLLLLDRDRPRTVAAGLIAVIAGAMVVAVVPGTANSLASGVRFFGGNPWLATIDEFQPVWKPLSRIPNYAAALLPGALAAAAMLIGPHRRRPAEFTIAVFTLAYVVATVTNRRFSTVSTAIAAVAAAMFIHHLWSRHGKRLAVVIATAIVVALPPLQLASWWASGVPSGLSGEAVNFFRAANFLRDRGGEGRVLAPWSYGHMFDVLGESPVVLDNFGTMPDPETFRVAHEILLSRDERAVAAFCDRYDIRYVVLETPFRGIVQSAKFAGIPIETFASGNRLRPEAGRTWYWSAFFDSAKLRAFRRIGGDDRVVILERSSRPVPRH